MAKAVFISVVVSLVAGALATSTAEYLFKYNLVDYIVEYVKGLFGKAKTDVAAAAANVAKKL